MSIYHDIAIDVVGVEMKSAVDILNRKGIKYTIRVTGASGGLSPFPRYRVVRQRFIEKGIVELIVSEDRLILENPMAAGRFRCPQDYCPPRE